MAVVCPVCGETESFWDEYSVAFYERRKRAWSDAVLFRCESCKELFAAILPLEHERTEIGRIQAKRLRPKEVLLSDAVPMARRWKDLRLWSLWCAWAAQFCSEVGAGRRAAMYALEACLAAKGRLSSCWYAWTVSLAEKARDTGLAAIGEQLLLERHQKDRLRLEILARRTPAAMVLLDVLESELKRLGRKLGKPGPEEM